jgi:integrase
MPRANRTGVRGLYRDGRGRYRIDLRWRDPNTGAWKRHRELLPRDLPAPAAKRRAADMQAAALAGTFVPGREASRKLRSALDEYLSWLATQRPKAVADRTLHAKKLVASLGNVDLDKIQPFGVERFKSHRSAEGCAPGTVNRHLTTLKHFVRMAADWNWMSREAADAVRRVRPLREPAGRVRSLQGDEEARLLAELPDAVRAIAVTAMVSGMRRSEIVGLRWSNVDLASERITLIRTKSNRVRHIPIHPSLAALLRRQDATEGATWVFPLPTLGAGRRAKLADEETRRRAYVSRGFKKAAAKAGVLDLRFHDLRHDFATRARSQGAGIDAIAKLLGHSTLAMAQRYTHIGDPTLRDVVQSIAAPRTTRDNVIDLAAHMRAVAT